MGLGCHGISSPGTELPGFRVPGHNFRAYESHRIQIPGTLGTGANIAEKNFVCPKVVPWDTNR